MIKVDRLGLDLEVYADSKKDLEFANHLFHVICFFVDHGLINFEHIFIKANNSTLYDPDSGAVGGYRTVLSHSYTSAKKK
jgi:hypothetical protein